MKFAILGSGFGLYGYLPAIAGLGHTVLLPTRYQEHFFARQELAKFATYIEWQVDERAALAQAAGVVIALRPEDQLQWVSQSLSFPNIDRFILEKPLAPTPHEAIELHRMLIESGKIFRVGYTFCDLEWTSLIRDFATTNPNIEISINWQFLAHHFQNDILNWKRMNAAGGGAIRFYGIQFIAVLAQIGYRDVLESCVTGYGSRETTAWAATFSGDGLPNCRIIVDCRSEVMQFDVSAKASSGLETTLFQSKNPFGDNSLNPISSALDPRVRVIQNLVALVIDQSTVAPSWYADTLRLWQLVEDRLDFPRGLP